MSRRFGPRWAPALGVAHPRKPPPLPAGTDRGLFGLLKMFVVVSFRFLPFHFCLPFSSLQGRPAQMNSVIVLVAALPGAPSSAPAAPRLPVPCLASGRTQGPPFPEAPSSPPQHPFSKEGGVSCFASADSCGGRSVRPGLSTARGERPDPCSGPRLASCGPLRPRPWFPFGSSFGLKFGFAFLCFVCISFNVVKVALQVSLQRACPRAACLYLEARCTYE